MTIDKKPKNLDTKDKLNSESAVSGNNILDTEINLNNLQKELDDLEKSYTSVGNMFKKFFALTLLCVSSNISINNVAKAEDISWVDFSNYVDGELSGTGFSSPDGLVLDVEFLDPTGFRSGFPSSISATIDDLDWPFDNTEVLTLGFISPVGENQSSTMRVDFTNNGGLPVGGSIAVVDLEKPLSSITFRGLANGVEVPVNWSLSYYETTDFNLPQPIWDPNTNTLTGNVQLGHGQPTLNTFTFLTTDTQLDSIFLDNTTANEDAIFFGFTTTGISNISPPTTPEPSIILGLLTVGGIALGTSKKGMLS